MMSSACLHIHELHSSKFLAISWPSAGASKTPPPLRRKTPGGREGGGEVSLKDELSLTRTLALFLTHSFSLSSLSLRYSHTHSPPQHTHSSSSLLTPSFSHQFPPFLLFSFFISSLSHSHMPSLPDEGDPPVSPSPEAPTYPREPCCGTARVMASELQVPSFISGRTGRKFPGKERVKKKESEDHTNQGQPS